MGVRRRAHAASDRGQISKLTAGLAVAGMILLWSSATSSALEVSIRGQAEISLDARPAGNTLKMSGILRDDVGDPLVQRTIEFAVGVGAGETTEYQTHTDFEGRYSFATDVPEGTYEIEAVYPGERHITSAEAKSTVEVESVPTELTVDIPRWIRGQRREVPVRIRATSGSIGLPTYSSIAVEGESVATVDLDWAGEGQFDLGPHLEEGANEIEIEVPATEYREAVETSRDVRLVTDVDIDGEVQPVFRRMERGYSVDLVVEDEHGPLEDAMVEVRMERLLVDRPDAPVDPGETITRSRRTDERGRVSVFASEEELGEAKWSVSARVLPPVGEPIEWRGETLRSEPSVLIRIARILAFLAILGGGLWLGRRGLSTTWGVLRRRLRRTRAESDSRVDPGDILAEYETGSLDSVGEEPGTDRTGHEIPIIELWNVWEERPVERGELVLYDSSGESVAELAAVDGGVEIVSAPENPAYLEARAPGFVPVRVALDGSIPDGRTRLSMTPVPLKIRRAYRWMVERTRGSDPWGRLTPREVEEALVPLDERTAGETTERLEPTDSWRSLLEDWDESGPEERVERLLRIVTRVVEETNYSGRQYDVPVWDSARRVMERLAGRLGSGGGAS